MKLSSRLTALFLCAVFLTFLPVASTNANDHRFPGGDKQGLTYTATSDSLIINTLGGSLTAQKMAEKLVGPGVTIENVSFVGSTASSGIFSGGNTIIGFEEGILLTSGGAINVVGPNIDDAISKNNNRPGDADLTILSGYPTYDAAVLEFDFIPNQDQIVFQFVFASDEYNEFVGSRYNDVFGFFINGKNCALVGNSPITVNSINANNQSELYINNRTTSGSPLNTEMDGLTRVITCTSAVIPNQRNHMKLAIADASDRIYDSAVFIKAGSITTERRPIVLIPGIGASVNYDCFIEFLASWATCHIEALWGWMPGAENYYAPLINRLEQAGYRRDNKYLSIFWYDWRQPVSYHRERLKKHIAGIKKETGKSSVDIIGHSMGGLVARSYIQSNIYDNDVEKLVTLGTPHKGSAKVYHLWQAADASQMDGIMKFGIAVAIAYKGAQDLQPIPVYALRDNFPGIRDLLPTYTYLRRSDLNNSWIDLSTMTHRNTNILSLNEGLPLLFQRVSVATIAGTDETTTFGFDVRPRKWWEWPNWDDGKPENNLNTNEGDDTVRVSSALLDGAYQQTISYARHALLPSNSAVMNEVFTYLNVSVAPSYIDPVITSPLAIFTRGPVRLALVDPQGRSISAAIPASDNNISTIPDTVYYTDPTKQFTLIIVTAPTTGRFELIATGVESGTYTIGIFDMNPAEHSGTLPITSLWETVNAETQPSATMTLSIDYDVAREKANLVFTQPLIQTPLWAGSTIVTGYALPFRMVEILDESSGEVLGSGTSSEDGLFSVSLPNPLKLNQRIIARVNETLSIAAIARGREVHLPLVYR